MRLCGFVRRVLKYTGTQGRMQTYTDGQTDRHKDIVASAHRIWPKRWASNVCTTHTRTHAHTYTHTHTHTLELAHTRTHTDTDSDIHSNCRQCPQNISDVLGIKFVHDIHKHTHTHTHTHIHARVHVHTHTHIHTPTHTHTHTQTVASAHRILPICWASNLCATRAACCVSVCSSTSSGARESVAKLHKMFAQSCGLNWRAVAVARVLRALSKSSPGCSARAASAHKVLAISCTHTYTYPRTYNSRHAHVLALSYENTPKYIQIHGGKG